ncbi:hypothetical protein D3C79_989320 [compost metagenome]
MMTVIGEGFVQPGAGQGGGWQVLVHSAQLPLQQVEAQAPGHGGVALTSHAGTGGNGFAHGQREVVEGKL